MDISCESVGSRYCEKCDYEAEDMNDINERADKKHTSPSFEGDEQNFFASTRIFKAQKK